MNRHTERPAQGHSSCSEDLQDVELSVGVYADQRRLALSEDEFIIPFGPHYHEVENRYPMLSNKEPFAGDTCWHEREWLEKRGNYYPAKWEFVLNGETITGIEKEG